jgi:hypothetical protein
MKASGGGCKWVFLCPGVYGGGGLVTVKSQKNKAKLIKIV